MFNLGRRDDRRAAAEAVAAVEASAAADGVATWVIGEVRAGAQGVRFAD